MSAPATTASARAIPTLEQAKAKPAPRLDSELLIEMYRRMLRIRKFEEAVIKLSTAAEIPGPIHTSIHQEAMIVGATLAVNTDDYMTGTHRSHGHPIGKGSSMDRLLAELFGKREGICKGKGGSMHLADFSVGSLGESGIVASGLPIAVGAALASDVLENRRVSLCFFGDGAANAGNVHESMNLAAIWDLPVIFFCENNGYAVTFSAARSTAVEDIATRAAGYDMPGIVVDGQDPVAVYEATHAAAERGRAGEGPSLVEAKSYRLREHAEGMPVDAYREAAEVEAWGKADPLPLFAAQLEVWGVLDSEGIAALEAEVDGEVEAAIAFARAGTDPSPEDAHQDLFATPLDQPEWKGANR